MTRNFIKFVVVKYGRRKMFCFFDGTCSRYFSSNKLSRNSTFFKNVIMKPISSTRKMFYTANSAFGFLSGCCFSKSADELTDPILETTESLLSSVEKEIAGTDKLSDVAQNLAAGVKNVYDIDDISENMFTTKPLNSITQTEQNNFTESSSIIPSTSQQSSSQTNNNSENRLTTEPLISITQTEKRNFTDNIVPSTSKPSSNLTNNTDTSVVVGFKKNKRRKRNAKQAENRIQENETVSVEHRPAQIEREPKIMPNYFVAFQISNPEIHQNVTKVQSHIIQQDRRLTNTSVSVLKSHITMMVMHLEDDEEHSKALEVLKIIHQELNASMSLSPLKLQFRGIGHFRNQVVFAKINDDEELSRLKDCAQTIQKHFMEAAIMSTDVNRTFNPHLTLMKLSQDKRLYRKGVKKINPSFYELYKNLSFGDETVKSIQLLSMTHPANKEGYYHGDELMFDTIS